MKVRILQPGAGPDFSFPVIHETNHSIYIQIEHGGKSFTFDLRQEDDGLIVRSSDSPMMITPKMGNQVVVRGPMDEPGKYVESAEAGEGSDG